MLVKNNVQQHSDIGLRVYAELFTLSAMFNQCIYRANIPTNVDLLKAHVSSFLIWLLVVNLSAESCK